MPSKVLTPTTTQLRLFGSRTGFLDARSVLRRRSASEMYNTNTTDVTVTEREESVRQNVIILGVIFCAKYARSTIIGDCATRAIDGHESDPVVAFKRSIF